MVKSKVAAKKVPAKKAVPAVKKKIIKEKIKPPAENTGQKNEKRSVITSEEVAKLAGVTTARVSQLKKMGVITPLPSGSRKEGDFYEPLKTFVSLTRYYQGIADSRGSKDSDEMKDAKERQAIAKAKLEENKLAVLDGELHKTEDIERIMGAILSRLRINLLAIPLGVAPQLRDQPDTNTIAEKINERICRALNEVVDLDLDKLIKADKEEYPEQET